MKSNKLVSVIIPCYNQGAYLGEALLSLKAQTYDNLEIILVNDGSTDSLTLEKINQISDPNIRLFNIPNSGVSYARNLAIKKSRGYYILPLDADDKIYDTYIEKAVGILDKNSKIGVVYSKARYFGARQGLWDLPDFKFPEILTSNCVFCTALFRKGDYLKTSGYNRNMNFGWEDWDLWLSFVELGLEFHRIPEILFWYRIKEVSRTTGMTLEKKTLMHSQIVRNHPDLYLKNLEFFMRDYYFLRNTIDLLNSFWIIRVIRKFRKFFKKYSGNKN